MKNIVLIGFMGCGKTEVGKILADKLGYTFIDTDSIIEKKMGKSISEIFHEYGEEHFRGLETGVVKELSGMRRCVISTGGGMVIHRENLLRLKKDGVMIWLKASPETIYGRVKSEHHRPLLRVEDPLQEINKLLGLREPLYAEADITIETDGLDIEKIVGKIVDAYAKF